MSAASTTKIFGVRLGLDPKILVGALIVMAGGLYWYNSHGDDTGAVATPAATAPRSDASGTAGPAASRRSLSRRSTAQQNDRGALRIRPIDASHGDVDPTLRLDLLARLSAVEQGKIGRSVFESGPAPLSGPNGGAPIKAPKITPVALPPVTPPKPPEPVVNVPLKYYGYVKPEEKSEANRGLFLDNDNVLIAVEGQTVKGHYLVVELTPTSARMEDTQMKKGQTLPVVPQAAQNP